MSKYSLRIYQFFRSHSIYIIVEKKAKDMRNVSSGLFSSVWLRAQIQTALRLSFFAHFILGEQEQFAVASAIRQNVVAAAKR